MNIEGVNVLKPLRILASIALFTMCAGSVAHAALPVSQGWRRVPGTLTAPE